MIKFAILHILSYVYQRKLLCAILTYLIPGNRPDPSKRAVATPSLL